MQRGYYILNPRMEIEVNDRWVNVYDLMQIEHLEQERDNPSLQRFVQYVRHWQKTATAAPAPESGPASGPSHDSPAVEEPATEDTTTPPPTPESGQEQQLPLFTEEYF